MAEKNEPDKKALRKAVEDEAYVCYSRVMFLGAAGVGKTSLRRSLMRQPWQSGATSTVVADLHTVRPSEWMEGGPQQWQQITHDDEIDEIAKLLAIVSMSDEEAEEFIKISSNVAAKPFSTKIAVLQPSEVSHDQVKHFERTVSQNILQQAVDKAYDVRYKKTSESTIFATQPFLHVWDCGGQPVFLETLPAFLTSRTMFLLLFDASKDFSSRWQSVAYQDGQEITGEMQNESTLDLLQQWMANIHANLTTEGIANYPRIMAIGTHGDDLRTQAQRDAKKEEFIQHCKDKAYFDLIDDVLIVDNTSAKKPGEEGEDPQFAVIRSKISEFTTKKLAVKAPVSWVLFRKVIQGVGKNVVSLEDAIAIGVACKIPQEDVVKALLFYHELGVILFYPHIKGLQDSVIINPQWFVKVLGKILVLEGREKIGKTARMWEALRKDGVLLSPLYLDVWSDVEGIDPQGIIKLLVHCYLAAPMDPKEKKYKDKFPEAEQYFVPAVLPIAPSPSISDADQRATPLHITFSTTKFVHPGFYTRLATSLIQLPKWQILFKDEDGASAYRDQLTFSYNNSINESVVLTAMQDAIQVDVLCHSADSSVLPFDEVCRDILHSVEECVEKVSKVLGSVKTVIKFVCNSETCGKPRHYLHINNNHTQAMQLYCEASGRRGGRRDPSPEEAYWFIPVSKPTSVPTVSVSPGHTQMPGNSQVPHPQSASPQTNIHCMPIAVPSMIQQYRLTSEQVNSQVTSPHLIARHIVNWKHVAPHLGLTEPDISAISVDGRDEQERRNMMLNMWIRRNGCDASYHRLLEVCVEAGDRELAKNICQEVRDQFSQAIEVSTTSNVHSATDAHYNMEAGASASTDDASNEGADLANSIRINSSKIMAAVHDVNMLSLRLCEKGVIPEGAYQTLVDGRARLSTDEAFHKLLIMVINAVRVDAKKFDKVLESLKECGAEELAEKIHKSSEPNDIELL